MSRILKIYDKSIFELSPSFTVVAFPYEEAFISPNGRINGKLNTTFDILKSNPAATIPNLAEKTSKSQRSISRELREYQKSGILWREGVCKNGKWIIRM